MMKTLICISVWLMALGVGTAQNTQVVLSGQLLDSNKLPIAYAAIQLWQQGQWKAGTLTAEDGQFNFNQVAPGGYELRAEAAGFAPVQQKLYVGALSPYLRLDHIVMTSNAVHLEAVEVKRQVAAVQVQLEKKTIKADEMTTQQGGSVLQLLQNVPGLVVQDGKLMVRGSDKLIVLIDGKQTALTGFGHQSALDNIPASAIDRIEIIQQPSAKYEANGQAGVVNLIMRKNSPKGWSGKFQLASGLGNLWQKQGNLQGVDPQYVATFKANPSAAITYRGQKWMGYAQVDYNHNPTLNKNEFVTRIYDDGTVVRQQTRRNRNTDIVTAKTGIEAQWTPRDQLSISALFSSEKIIDYGQEPFFNADLSQRSRLWDFLEDELKTTATLTLDNTHALGQPGHQYQWGVAYTFHREDEKYFFNNINPSFVGYDHFKLLSDENVTDAHLDYQRPLSFGKLELGLKYRYRNIPTMMAFYPGINSPFDVQSGGAATYNEQIPAVYANAVIDRPHYEIEAGLRAEYVDVHYRIAANNPAYQSSGYQYLQPFPNLRFTLKPDSGWRWSLMYNRRVDRPNEFDLRVFPKYDDVEIVKIGDPSLKPQFTQNLELGTKKSQGNYQWYVALYQRFVQGTITRITTQVPGSTILYNIMQNAGNSQCSGVELQWSTQWGKWQCSVNGTAYRNQIDAFALTLLYPQPTYFQADREVAWSGNVRANVKTQWGKGWKAQTSAAWLAPDVVPQGRTNGRFSLDMGINYQKGHGQWFLNASDLFNTLVIRKQVRGNGFQYTATDYLETQVIRAGYIWQW